ncbi:hypothetical protein CTAYLR_002330 [Chrysophaeum taylorii]|uniref:Nucleotide-diphospho-sugar transferase domain-containing protein n=1 Tax=Chrysophaeum taylorii TaxID=2483200 RepID=A0AAD7UGX4_9STRA|nr:hypothetical protein CTAYLR_002330 [Chrysophaeum taylorii]
MWLVVPHLVVVLTNARRKVSRVVAPRASFLSVAWTKSILAANGLWGVPPQPRGVVYLAVGAGSLEKAIRSARSVRAWASDLGILLVSDSSGAARASKDDGVFDLIVSAGAKSAKIQYEEVGEYEGFRDRGGIGLENEFLSKRGLGLKRLRTLKVRSLMIGLRLFRTALFLDTDTAVCGSLEAVFGTREDVAFVTIPGGRAHAQELVARAYGVPESFPEANTGVLLIRNSSRTQRLLANWNVAYHTLAQRDDRLMDQPAFRAALFKSGATFGILDRKYNCRGRDRRRKEAIPLACGSKDDRFGRCVVIHSHAITPDPPDPNGLPNFFLSNVSADVYRNAPAVFLHIPKAAGNSVKQLFVKRVLRRRGRDRSLHIDTRRAWDSDLSGEQRSEAAVLYGAFSFGACATHPKGPCAYYVIFRDPVARLLSEFKYCRAVDFSDQCCAGRRGAAAMRRVLTLDDWAEEKGNFMLEHLLRLTPLDWGERGSWRKQNPETRVNPIETRRRRDGPARHADLDLALANLDNWFAVVGLTKRYDDSLALFSYVLTGQVIPRSLVRSVHTHNQHSTNTSLSPPNTTDRILRAVALDLQLYGAAEEIFDRQVSTFLSHGLNFISRRR